MRRQTRDSVKLFASQLSCKSLYEMLYIKNSNSVLRRQRVSLFFFPHPSHQRTKYQCTKDVWHSKSLGKCRESQYETSTPLLDWLERLTISNTGKEIQQLELSDLADANALWRSLPVSYDVQCTLTIWLRKPLLKYT